MRRPDTRVLAACCVVAAALTMGTGGTGTYASYSDSVVVQAASGAGQ